MTPDLPPDVVLQIYYPTVGARSRFYEDGRWLRLTPPAEEQRVEVRPRLGPGGDRLTDAALARLRGGLDALPEAALDQRLDGGLTGDEVVPPGRTVRPKPVVFSFRRDGAEHQIEVLGDPAVPSSLGPLEAVWGVLAEDAWGRP